MKKRIIGFMLTGMAILALTGCQNNKKNSSVAKQNGVGQVKKTNHSNNMINMMEMV